MKMRLFAMMMSGLLLAAAPASAALIYGEVTNLDPDQDRMELRTIRAPEGTPTNLAMTADDSSFKVGGGPNSIDDLEVGQKVVVEADKEQGDKVWKVESILRHDQLV